MSRQKDLYFQIFFFHPLEHSWHDTKNLYVLDLRNKEGLVCRFNHDLIKKHVEIAAEELSEALDIPYIREEKKVT